MSRAVFLRATCLSGVVVGAWMAPAAADDLIINGLTVGIDGGSQTYTNVRVGEYGSDASLSLFGGAIVNAESSIIGWSFDATNNTAIVTGNETLWNTQELFYVGLAGSNNGLQIKEGGFVKAKEIFVGFYAPASENTLEVSGPSSKIEADNLVVGVNGRKNQLLITNGGEVNTQSFAIGSGDTDSEDDEGLEDQGSENFVSVSGSGSELSSTTLLVVGSNGKSNELKVEAGGIAKTDGLFVIGAYSPDNTVTVDGKADDKASRLEATALAVGAKGGANTLTISNGAEAQSQYGIIGAHASANGNQAVISGGAVWMIARPGDSSPADTELPAGSILLGARGSLNILIVNEGGKVDTKGDIYISGDTFTAPESFDDDIFSDYGVFENGMASSNSVFVAGADGVKTRMTSNGITVGVQGDSNKVEVMTGGYLETKGDARIGNAQNTDNRVIVTGAGSLWTVNGNLDIAGEDAAMTLFAARPLGPNRLNIQDGGLAVIGNDLTVQGNGKIDLGAGGRLEANTLTLSGTSQVSVYIDDESNSSIAVKGEAELDGGLDVKIGTDELMSNRYTLLTADKVSGTFDNFSFDYNEGFNVSFLKDSRLVYSNKSVSVLFKSDIGGDDDLTRNQDNVSSAINRYYNDGGEISENFVPLLGMSGDTVLSTLDDLSGEVGSTGGNNQINQAADGFTGLLTSQSTQTASTVTASADMGDVGIMPAAGEAPSSGWTMWGSAFGGKSSLPGNASLGSHDTDTDLIGLATGWDYAVSSDTMVGFAIAGGGTRWDLADGLGNGESTFLQFGARGTQRIGASYLAFAGSYAWHWMETERNALGDTLEADFAASSIAGRIEGGHRFGETGDLGLTPYAALIAQASFLPDYEESGGSAALAFESRTATSLRSELGLRLDHTADAIRLDAGLAWAHDWQSKASVDAAFRSLPGASFTVNGAESPENLALVTAGAEFGLGSQTTLSARFDGEFGKDYSTYGGTLALSYNW